jgi:CRISP-associated protein Cas1
MTNRVLDFSEAPAYLHVSHSRLTIKRDGDDDISLPLAEVAVLIAAHPQVRITQAVLAGLAVSGGVFVVCDARRLPVGMMLPLDGHHWQVSRVAKQAAAKLPVKKRTWQQIVRSKILAQARVLEECVGVDRGLRKLVNSVLSGDSTNIEAQAARRYWQTLFGKGFRRDRDAMDANLLLNYGYGVLRAITARSICATGLHPALGLHHHNRSSGYPLADDLMEPFRPIVDRCVNQWIREQGPPSYLTPESKRFVVDRLLTRIPWRGEQRSLFDATFRIASSLVAVLSGERDQLELA